MSIVKVVAGQRSFERDVHLTVKTGTISAFRRHLEAPSTRRLISTDRDHSITKKWEELLSIRIYERCTRSVEEEESFEVR